MAKRNKKSSNVQNGGLYTMGVYIVSGPIKDDFVKKNPIIGRIIEIRGDQTLEEFHHIIFKAFDRKEEHMYEFQIGGKGPNDPNAKQFGLPEDDKGDASKTTISSLKLKTEDVFGYWFDFGDDWWHQVNVMSIKEEIPTGSYPKVIEKTGDSPPQYPEE